MGWGDQLSDVESELQRQLDLLDDHVLDPSNEELPDLTDAEYAESCAAIYVRGAIQQIQLARRICDRNKV